MNIVYTALHRVPQGDFACRNPQYFQGVESGAENVLVVGSWPDIVAAYEAVEVNVSTISEAEFSEVPLESDVGRLPEGQERELLMDELREKGVEFDDSMGTDELRALTITEPDVDGQTAVETEGTTAADDQASDPADERKTLMAELKQKNISFAKNASTEKLRELLQASDTE